MVSQKGHLTTHTKICKKILSGANFAERVQDQQTSTLNIDAHSAQKSQSSAITGRLNQMRTL